jgi:(p)ppGpp synthase/HD superfamily hydrolase
MWFKMPKSEVIERAKRFAQDKHRNQKDDNGFPYFYHVEQVARILGIVTKELDIIACGYLHDTLEDTETTFEELKENFGSRIASLILEVTHEGKKDTEGYYFPRLQSKDAILIKFADRLSNLSRMESWAEDRQNQYLRKSKFWKSEI